MRFGPMPKTVFLMLNNEWALAWRVTQTAPSTAGQPENSTPSLKRNSITAWPPRQAYQINDTMELGLSPDQRTAQTTECPITKNVCRFTGPSATTNQPHVRKRLASSMFLMAMFHMGRVMWFVFSRNKNIVSWPEQSGWRLHGNTVIPARKGTPTTDSEDMS